MHDGAREPNNNLSQRVDGLIDSRCCEEEFLRQLTELCAGARDSAWTVLARVDQNYRRGKLSPERFRLARVSIERRMLGFNDVRVASMAPRPREPVHATPPLAIEALAVIEAPRPPKSESVPAPAVHLGPPSAAAKPRAIDRASRQGSGLDAPRRRWRGPLMVAILAALAAGLIAQMQRTNRTAGAPVVLTQPATAVPPVTAPEAVSAAPARPRPRIGFDSDRFVVQPGQSVAEVLVTRAGDISAEVRIPWWTESAGARAGKDFVARGLRTLVLAPGVERASVRVPILRNPRRRHIELFYVRLGKPQGGELNATTRAAIFIVPR